MSQKTPVRLVRLGAARRLTQGGGAIGIEFDMRPMRIG